jgi:hypothetical protein
MAMPLSSTTPTTIADHTFSFCPFRYRTQTGVTGFTGSVESVSVANPVSSWCGAILVEAFPVIAYIPPLRGLPADFPIGLDGSADAQREQIRSRNPIRRFGRDAWKLCIAHAVGDRLSVLRSAARHHSTVRWTAGGRSASVAGCGPGGSRPRRPPPLCWHRPNRPAYSHRSGRNHCLRAGLLGGEAGGEAGGLTRPARAWPRPTRCPHPVPPPGAPTRCHGSGFVALTPAPPQ